MNTNVAWYNSITVIYYMSLKFRTQIFPSHFAQWRLTLLDTSYLTDYLPLCGATFLIRSLVNTLVLPISHKDLK